MYCKLTTICRKSFCFVFVVFVSQFILYICFIGRILIGIAVQYNARRRSKSNGLRDLLQNMNSSTIVEQTFLAYDYTQSASLNKTRAAVFCAARAILHEIRSFVRGILCQIARLGKYTRFNDSPRAFKRREKI